MTRVLASALATAIALATPALAEPLGDPAAIAEQVCSGIGKERGFDRRADLPQGNTSWRAVSPTRLAYFLLAARGRIGSQASAVAAIAARERNHYPDGDKLWDTVAHFQMQLAAGNTPGLLAFDENDEPIAPARVDREKAWLLDERIVLRCALPANDAATVASGGEADGGKESPPRLDLRLRGTVEALALTGERRKSADAATIGFSRVRAYQEDGSRKQTTNYDIEAVVGAPLPINGSLAELVVYTGYELARERSKPAPALTPPARQRDGDTEVLKLGVTGQGLIDLSTGKSQFRTSLTLSVDNSYIFDFVTDSERFRTRLAADFYHRDAFLGLCRLGDYYNAPGSRLWTRCDLQAIADFDVLTARGKLPKDGSDTFGHIGGQARFRAYLGDTVADGPFVTAEYLRLQRVRGERALVPHIRRHMFNFGYRWWNADTLALEFKAELVDGINPDSFADENTLSLGFGILF